MKPSSELRGLPDTRHKLGFLVPTFNRVVERESLMMKPRDVDLFFSVLEGLSKESTYEVVSKIPQTLGQAIASLDSSIEVMALCCTSGSFCDGPGYDQELIKTMMQLGSKKATTTSTAVVDAIKALGARTVDVCTPYPDELTMRIPAFLGGNDIQVSNLIGLGIKDGSEDNVAPSRILELANQTNTKNSDALFISCTNFPASIIIEDLEEKLRKPVITSNQATIWSASRMSGSRASVKGFGRLLREN